MGQENQSSNKRETQSSQPPNADVPVRKFKGIFLTTRPVILDKLATVHLGVKASAPTIYHGWAARSPSQNLGPRA